MPLIYLIRHGRPRLPDDSPHFLGQTNLSLSRDAREELLPTSKYLSNKGITAVVTSPLVRCAQTAQILFGSDIRHTICPELIEINMDTWEMLTTDELKRTHPGEYERRGRDLAAYKPPGGESFLDVQQRAVTALLKLAQESTGPTAVIAHAGVNRCGAVTAAAGKSSHMGSFKLLLPLRDSTIIEEIVSTLRLAGIDDITVVIGREAGRMERLGMPSLTDSTSLASVISP